MAELKKIVYKEFEERLMVGVHNNTSFLRLGTHGNLILKVIRLTI